MVLSVARMLRRQPQRRKNPSRLVRGIGDIARGMGRLLHAKENEERTQASRPQDGKNVHGPLKRKTARSPRANDGRQYR
jgi:hypothetical protein